MQPKPFKVVVDESKDPRYPCLRECTGYEGDYSDLVNTGCRKKYTHHPIAVFYEARKDRRFRHLSDYELNNLIREQCYTRIMLHYNDIPTEVDPINTIFRVGVMGGISCFLCDNFVHEKSKSIYEGMDDCPGGQYMYSILSDDIRGLPYLCKTCLKKAALKKVPENYHNYSSKGMGLLGLVAILRENISEKFNVRQAFPQQRRQRRARTSRPD